jgi:hypothetical protein
MRWGHVGGGYVVAGLRVVGLARVGCADDVKRATDDVVRAEVVDYAEGDWRCELVLPAEAIPATLGGSGTLGVDATLRATGDAEGDVVFAIDSRVGAGRGIAGAGELDGTDLKVDIPALVETSYAMAGADIATAPRRNGFRRRPSHPPAKRIGALAVSNERSIASRLCGTWRSASRSCDAAPRA